MLYISDEKVFEAVDVLISLGKVRFQNDVWEAIGIKKQTITYIRRGRQHFRIHHITNLCRIYKIDANWVLGLSDTMFIKGKLKENTK